MPYTFEPTDKVAQAMGAWWRVFECTTPNGHTFKMLVLSFMAEDGSPAIAELAELRGVKPCRINDIASEIAQGREHWRALKSRTEHTA